LTETSISYAAKEKFSLFTFDLLSLHQIVLQPNMCTHRYSNRESEQQEVIIMETAKVGIREFRADLAEYIASSVPVAVTRHGQTVGYFIPTQGQVDADLAALKKASKTLDQMLAAQEVDVEAVVAEFKTVRKQTTPRNKPLAKAA
jgi:antitoxin (DNA-binding transcriptional repressor) of toxin-antitoxin stability system